MAGKLKDLYVKRNQNQYQPAADSWEARAAELSNVSEGAMPQGETAGNGVFGWLKDSADAGFLVHLVAQLDWLANLCRLVMILLIVGQIRLMK